MAILTNRFPQVILYVRDMASEVWFYHDLLGLPIRTPKGVADYAAEMWVEFETGSCILALHGGSTETPNDQHELVFTVKDIQAAFNGLTAAGVNLSPIRTLETGAPIASGLDPDGHRFSIREGA